MAELLKWIYMDLKEHTTYLSGIIPVDQDDELKK